MRRFLPVVLSLFFVIFAFLSTPSASYAADSNCKLNVSSIFGENSLPATFSGVLKIKPASVGCNFSTTGQYLVLAYPNLPGLPEQLFKGDLTTLKSNTPAMSVVQATSPTELIADIDLNGGYLQRVIGIRDYYTGAEYPDQSWTVAVCKSDLISAVKNCTSKKYFFGEGSVHVGKKTPTASQVTLPKIDVVTQKECTFQAGTAPTVWRITNLSENTSYSWWWQGDPFARQAFVTKPGQLDAQFEIPADATDTVGTKKFCIEKTNTINVNQAVNIVKTAIPIVGAFPIATTYCETNGILLNFSAGPPAPGAAQCSRANAGDFKLPDPARPESLKLLCAENSLLKTKDIWGEPAYECLKVNTAIGDIDTKPAAFVKKIFSIILSLAGGILLLIIIATGYRFMTSQGDPEKLKAARETLTSAIVGLLFMIFALVILQVVGVDILKIPGFEK